MYAIRSYYDDKNVKTKQGSNDLVEFAIKLPGKVV